METIKRNIHTLITASVCPCTVHIKERCIIIILDEHPRHMVFVQPDK